MNRVRGDGGRFFSVSRREQANSEPSSNMIKKEKTDGDSSSQQPQQIMLKREVR